MQNIVLVVDSTNQPSRSNYSLTRGRLHALQGERMKIVVSTCS